MNYLQKTPFMKLYEELSLFNSVLMTESVSKCVNDVTKQLYNFAMSFWKAYPNAFAFNPKLENYKKLYEDTIIKNTAFHINALGQYYLNASNKDEIASCLKQYGISITGGFRSLQYLYNADIQENFLILKLAGLGLSRNKFATHLDTSFLPKDVAVGKDEEYRYLIAPRSKIGIKADVADFKLTFTDKEFFLDAKIGVNLENVTEHAHDADFIIWYNKNKPSWHLCYKKNTDEWDIWQKGKSEYYTKPEYKEYLLAINTLADNVNQLGELTDCIFSW